MIKTVIMAVVACLALSGCSGNKDPRVASLEGKVNENEGRLESMEQRLTALELYFQDIFKEKEEAALLEAEALETVSARDMTDYDIQIALTGAGFYSGPIDGKIGPKTSACIMEFQKANGLTADGVAGDKTKAELVKYLKADGR